MQTRTMDSKSSLKRVDYLDMLKCIGMFIVVSGHIHIDYGWFSLPIHGFVIPLYFMLSGMTFKSTKFPTLWTFVKHRTKTLLLPYLMFSILTWLFWAIYNTVTHVQGDIWSPLLQTFIAQGSGGFLVHNVPLWFLPCLFIVEVLYYLIDKLPKWINLLICVLISGIGTCMIAFWRGVFILLPWSIESALVAILFYSVGNILVKQLGLIGIQEKVLGRSYPINVIIVVLLSAVLINTAHWNGHISLGSDYLGRNPLLFYLNAFIGIITTTIFAILVCSLNRNNKFVNALINYQLWFGRNSLYIMATHVPVKGIIIVMISKILERDKEFVVNDWLCMAVVFVLTCVICSIFSYYIVKLKKRDELCVQKRIAK